MLPENQTADVGYDQMIAEVSDPGQTPGGETQAPVQTDGFDFTKIPSDQLLKYEMEYQASGRQVKEPLEMILKSASQGYHYAQQMAELKRKEQEWVPKEERLKSLEKWNTYQEYAAQNPQWAQHVEDMWERRSQLQQQGGEDPNSPVFQELQALKQELGPLKEFVGTLKEQQAQAQRAEEDKALDAQIKSVRESFPNVDFDLADGEGKSLEFKVFEHAQKNGINSFRAAFLDFHHDHLMKSTAEKAKEELVKNQQAQRKAGILGTSKESAKGEPGPERIKGRTYDDLAREAMTAYGIS